MEEKLRLMTIEEMFFRPRFDLAQQTFVQEKKLVPTVNHGILTTKPDLTRKQFHSAEKTAKAEHWINGKMVAIGAIVILAGAGVIWLYKKKKREAERNSSVELANKKNEDDFRKAIIEPRGVNKVEDHQPYPENKGNESIDTQINRDWKTSYQQSI